MSKVQDTQRTIELIEAVQGNAGVGLTRGDIDDIVEVYRRDDSVARIADFIDPSWRITAVRSIQTRTVDAAAKVRDALHAHEAKWGRP